MKYKTILLLLVISFNAEANFEASALEDIMTLSQQNEIPYEEGIEALLTLPDIFSARNFDQIENPEEQEEALRKSKTQYNGIHNRLFILTHIARIRHQISAEAFRGHFRPTRHKWQTQERMTRLKIKRDQLQVLEQTLQIITAADFDHSKHSFNALSDLGKINTESLTDTEGSAIDTFSSGFSRKFSKGFSKHASKGGYASNPFYTPSIRTDSSPMNDLFNITDFFYITKEMIDDLKAAISEEKARAFEKELARGNIGAAFAIFENPARARERRLRKLRDYSRQFVFRYRRAQAFDQDYESIPLPEEALPFLNRLGIEGPTPYFVQKDLSRFYRTASPSQAKSNACVGFALAADIDFEMQRAGQIGRNEILSPYSVYATLRYREEEIQAPDCQELQRLSHIIAEGIWEMDIGIANLDFIDTYFCLTSPSNDTTSPTGYVSVKNMEIYEGEVTFALLKAMIDHQKPPLLIIDSDARKETEDWINITNHGQFGHVFVAVGYGTEDIDPFSLRKGPYFLVRDSLASQPITYKISAKNLLDHSLAVLKTTQLERH